MSYKIIEKNSEPWVHFTNALKEVQGSVPGEDASSTAST